MMFFYYGFRDRKAYAEAAPVRPRFVRTIKPVKQPVKLHASYSHVRIINQDDGVFPSPESYSYHSIRIAVLYSIIQQDRNKPVSYTHLDVYKRQIFYKSDFKLMEFHSAPPPYQDFLRMNLYPDREESIRREAVTPMRKLPMTPTSRV